MSEQTAEVMIETAAITDRGLNEKRPLNEDSYLLDPEQRIFAVADGVGGAEAGEVASKTAVEVLAEAFRHHQAGEDVEDLMELAIQRANASIYQLSHEQRRFAMMATTIVALHMDGRRATIGHVGDSRLYRIAPDGQIHRETEDHSVVEEEVRAGRMTAEQAAHHPSRNVISRALGAEPSVEVDMKTIEAADGTIFLLCSDGITRHITDAELSALLREADTLDAACAEMKRRCLERGAEDNLTAVLVRVGAPAARPAPPPALDDEQTMARERPASVPAPTSPATVETEAAPSLIQRPFANAGAGGGNTRVVVPAPQRDEPPPPPHANGPLRGSARRSVVGRAGTWFGVLLIVLGAAALAFYGGMRYQRARAVFDKDTTAFPAPGQTGETSEARFERRRREVDTAPTAAAQHLKTELDAQAPDARDPQAIYLYGRALLLSGKQAEAMQVFGQLIQALDAHGMRTGRDPLRIETRIATAAAALKSKDPAAQERAARELDEVFEQPGGGADLASPSPAPSQ